MSERRAPTYIKGQRSLRFVGVNFSSRGASAAVEFYDSCEDISIIGARWSNDNGEPSGAGIRVKGTLDGLTIAGVHIEDDAFYASPTFLKAADVDQVNRVNIVGLDPELARGNAIHKAANRIIALGDGGFILTGNDTAYIGERGTSNIAAREPFLALAEPREARIVQWVARASRGPGGSASTVFRLRIDGVEVDSQTIENSSANNLSASKIVSIPVDAGERITCEVESSAGAQALGVGADVLLYGG